MGTKIKNIAALLGLSLIPTLLIWLPFALRLGTFWGIPIGKEGMATIVANYDGPLFLVVAKTFYNLEAIALSYSFPLSLEYWAAHFPLFPLLIRMFSVFLGYPYAMLGVTCLSSVLALYFFRRLARIYVDKKSAWWLTAFFAIFPARWLIVRSVGAAEPLFVAAIIASLYYFIKGKYWIAGLWGAVAAATKSPGIILFFSYLAWAIIPNIKKVISFSFSRLINVFKLDKIYPVFLIPLAVLGVFTLYGFQFGNFFAYFNSGDNIHLFILPFSVFNYSAPWVGTFWLEEIIFVYLIGAFGVAKLIRQGRHELAFFAGIYFLSLLFVSHRDLIRYALPLVPLMYIAFSETVTKKPFRLAFLVIIIPIYLFSLAFISQSVMPISNWGPFL